MRSLSWLTHERAVGTRPAPSLLDGLAALVLLVIALVELASGMFPGPVAIAAAFQLGAIVPVAFRRVAPVAAIAVTACLLLPYAVLYGMGMAGGSVANSATELLLAYSVGRHTGGRRLLAGAFFAVVVASLPAIAAHARPSDWVADLITTGGSLVLGVALRIQTDRSIALAVAVERGLGEQAAAAWAAVHEERARIASELHDVVAHNVGLIVLQAGGARSVLDSEPQRARTALLAIEQTGRQTLADMRRLVGVLRLDSDPELQPPRVDRPANPGMVRARCAGDVRRRPLTGSWQSSCCWSRLWRR